jgi:hypothetical protein
MKNRKIGQGFRGPCNTKCEGSKKNPKKTLQLPKFNNYYHLFLGSLDMRAETMAEVC